VPTCFGYCFQIYRSNRITKFRIPFITISCCISSGRLKFMEYYLFIFSLKINVYKIMMRWCKPALLSFNNNLDVITHLPYLFHLVSLLLSTGPLSLRASIYGLVMNIIHSILTCRNLKCKGTTVVPQHYALLTKKLLVGYNILNESINLFFL